MIERSCSELMSTSLKRQANASGVHLLQGEPQEARIFVADGGQSWALSEQLVKIVEGAFGEEQLGGQAVQGVRVVDEVGSGRERDAHRSQSGTVEVELRWYPRFNRKDPQVL